MSNLRMGLIGPAGNSSGQIERAFELLIGDAGMQRVVYLGADGAIETIAAAWSHTRLAQEEFLRRAVEHACTGSADDITQLLAAERENDRLSVIRKLPDAPARAIEMMDRWIVLAVHDKAVLDEDDIANAHIIVYGRSEEASLKRFGPRCFFTPGPLASGKVGCLELMPDGHVQIHLLDLEGKALWSESVQATSGKLVVTP